MASIQIAKMGNISIPSSSYFPEMQPEDDIRRLKEESQLFASSLAKSIVEEIEKAERNKEKRRSDFSEMSIREDSETEWQSRKNIETPLATFRRLDIPSWLRGYYDNYMLPSKFKLGLMSTRNSLSDNIEAVRFLLHDDNLNKCLQEIWELRNYLRDWYDERLTKNINDKELVRILFFDGCFIISKLVMFCTDDFPFEVPKLEEELDELLFPHNQIPLSVLAIILRIMVTRSELVLVRHYFSDHWSFIVEHLNLAAYHENSKEETFHCLLHMYHHYNFSREHRRKLEGLRFNFFPAFIKEWVDRNRKSGELIVGPKVKKATRIYLPSATKLKHGGVEFVRKDTYGEISFRHGKLSIPSLDLSDKMTISLLAFEQWQERAPHSNQMSTSMLVYVIACLVITDRDLELLDNCDIVERGGVLSNEHILNLFGNVRKYLRLNFDNDIDCKISHVSKEISSFTRQQRWAWGNKWWVWWTNLKTNYFTTPWTVISLVAAIALLIMTCIQTFFTVYAYYHPSSQ